MLKMIKTLIKFQDSPDQITFAVSDHDYIVCHFIAKQIVNMPRKRYWKRSNIKKKDDPLKTLKKVVPSGKLKVK